MNKQDVINKMQELVEVEGSSKKECGQYLDAFLGVLEYAVENKEEVKIAGYFGMEVKEKASRTGRNPQTGETIQIPAKNAIKTTIYKKLKELAL